MVPSTWLPARAAAVIHPCSSRCLVDAFFCASPCLRSKWQACLLTLLCHSAHVASSWFARKGWTLSPEICVLISWFSLLSVKRFSEIAATAAGFFLPQVILLLITAILRIREEDVTLARKEKALLPTRMAWRNACLADSAKRVPNLTKP